MTDARLLIAGLLLVDSVYYIFARVLLPFLPPVAGAMYMLALGAVEIAVVMRGRIDWGVLRRHGWLFLAVGGLVGVNTNMGFAAVQYVDPARRRSSRGRPSCSAWAWGSCGSASA